MWNINIFIFLVLPKKKLEYKINKKINDYVADEVT